MRIAYGPAAREAAVQRANSAALAASLAVETVHVWHRAAAYVEDVEPSAVGVVADAVVAQTAALGCDEAPSVEVFQAAVPGAAEQAGRLVAYGPDRLLDAFVQDGLRREREPKQALVHAVEVSVEPDRAAVWAELASGFGPAVSDARDWLAPGWAHKLAVDVVGTPAGGPSATH